ncbi:MAG TPA: L,D-transpeptidase family protein [Candidatus Competibacteraceae bacterium]|nr:L,D-transpeptidase family protein [Candidatus Competibacteraceae bacterium]
MTKTASRLVAPLLGLSLFACAYGAPGEFSQEPAREELRSRLEPLYSAVQAAEAAAAAAAVTASSAPLAPASAAVSEDDANAEPSADEQTAETMSAPAPAPAQVAPPPPVVKPKVELFAAGLRLRQPGLVLQFYGQRDYRPAWLAGDGISPAAEELLGVLSRADEEGLRPQDYRRDAIVTAIAAVRAAAEATPLQLADLELLLSDAFLHYARHLLIGRIGERKVDKDWRLPPRSHDLVALLGQAVDGAQVKTALHQVTPPHPEYQRLKQALARYRALAAQGGWPQVSPGPKLVLGERSPRVRELRARLHASGDLAGGRQAAGTLTKIADKGKSGSADTETLFDRELYEAVKRFQRRHGLDDDGVVGEQTVAVMNVPVQERIRQIELNLERWRWMPASFSERYIKVDLTGFTMSIIESGRTIYSDKIVVGMERRPTPVFTANMSYLVFSPYWHVPRTIAIEDKLPMLRGDPYALARQNIRIFNREGQEIDPGSVDWYSVSKGYFPFRMRQDPGKKNALGRVKFMLPNPYSVYLHDTSNPELFARAERTYSSGCIRVSRPLELAEYLLRDDPRWDRDAIFKAYDGGKQRTVKLPQEIPVFVQYWTAWADEEGNVQFRKDIYKRDPALAEALYPTQI